MTIKFIETWDEMLARHHKEKINSLVILSQNGYTQTEAAHILGMTKTHLNIFVKRNKIVWKVKRQGHRDGQRNFKRRTKSNKAFFVVGDRSHRTTAAM